MSSNRTVALLLACWGCVSVAASAAPIDTAVLNWDAEVELLPIIDGAMANPTQLVPKQSVKMRVSVWHPNTVTWVAKHPDWDMPGASIERTNTPAAYHERNKGELLQYGQSQDYILTPVDIGTLALTQTGIDVSPSGDNSEIVPLTQPVQLTVSLPDGAYDLDRFLPAYDLSLEQAFYLYRNGTPPAQLTLNEVAQLTLNQGDMLERRVTQIAKGTQSHVIPNPIDSDPNGNAYSEVKLDEVKGIFGFEAGKRIDAYYYTPTSGGTLEMPEITVQWWNLSDNQMQSLTLAGASFESAEVTVYEQQIALGWWQRLSGTLFTWLAYGLIGLGSIVIAVRLGKGMVRAGLNYTRHSYRLISNNRHTQLSLLCLSLLLAPQSTGKIRLGRWLRQGHRPLQQNQLPKPLVDCLSDGYQRQPTNRMPSRWCLVVACLELAQTNSAGSVRRYRLPEL